MPRPSPTTPRSMASPIASTFRTTGITNSSSSITAIRSIRSRFPRELSPMFDPFLQRHYAVLQSAYSQTGWAVEQGYADTEKLRQYFEKKYGKPKRAFVMRHVDGRHAHRDDDREQTRHLRRRAVAVRRAGADRPPDATRLRPARRVRLLLSRPARPARAGARRLRADRRNDREDQPRLRGKSRPRCTICCIYTAPPTKRISRR